MHSAEHILTGTLVRMFACGRPFTTHLEKKKSKADYAFSRALSQIEVEEIERQVNDVIARDLPVRAEFLPREAAATAHDLSRLPEETGEIVRIVSIGDYDA